jgi:peptidoglycan hydrolase CwlO-like protein
MATRLISLAVKTVVVLLLLSLGPLAFLVLTMDREGALLNEINASEAYIQTQKDVITSAEQEREILSQKIQSMQADDVPRETRLEIMEMNVKIHSLDQSRHRAEAEIADHENRIKDRKQRVQEVREKPFLDRLLRR